MPIRLRLTLSYGGLFALILLLVSLLSYAIHTRSQYDDLDRTLVVSAGHAAQEAATVAGGPHLVIGNDSIEIVLRLYGSQGVLLEHSPNDVAIPASNPRAILQQPAGPPYDVLAQVVPGFFSSSPNTFDGTFGLLTSNTQRWRVAVLPVHSNGSTIGYVGALTPLGRVDASVQTFRLLLLVLDTGGLTLALLGSWLISRRALHPLATMTQTAQSIALSHDLSARIDAPANHDELGHLAQTFNEMLESIDAAYQTQKRFVSDASHELRAPLTALQGNLELLKRKQAIPEAEREEILTEIECEASRMTRLVADLLVLARADAGIVLKRCPVDLDATALEAFREARHLAQGQSLTLDPFVPARVEGDEDRLKQLVLGLLDNALKYTPAEGLVTVGLIPKGSEVEVIVSDTGVGISAEDLPHVFERFYRADPARGRDPGGTGLGLSIARWIVEQHEGEIRIESELNKGTTVRVRLPLGSRP
jgi:two-component system, OmpR family, sensor kinase